MPKVVNLTPHEICVADEAGNVIRRYPPSGIVARCAVSAEPVGEVDGVPVVRSSFGEVQGLPEVGDYRVVVYLVSSMVAQAAANRLNVVAPDTGPTAVRDEQGRIVAVRRFQKF